MSSLPRLCLIIAALSCFMAKTATADVLWPKDKRKHFAATALIGAAGYLGASIRFDSSGARIAIGSGCGLGVGVAKELYDLTGRGTPSWADLGWDLIGTGTGVAAAHLTTLLIQRSIQSPSSYAWMPPRAPQLQRSNQVW